MNAGKIRVGLFVIGPVTIEETKQLFTVLRCGGGWVFTEEKSVCKHVNTLTPKLVTERGGYLQKMVKVKCALRVMLNHPYIGAKSANGPHEVWCLFRRQLMIVWTVVMEFGCIPVWWSAHDSVCFFTVFCLVRLGLWLNTPCFIGLQAGTKQFESPSWTNHLEHEHPCCLAYENCSYPF